MSIPESHPGTGKHVAAVTETVKEIPRYMQASVDHHPATHAVPAQHPGTGKHVAPPTTHDIADKGYMH